jgi:signal transduction histidine kinase
VTLLSDVRFSDNVNPLWWRYPVWIALTAVSVVQTHGTTSRIVGGTLMVAAIVALQFVQHGAQSLRWTWVVSATALALGACFAMPQGLAEVIVGVVATRAPEAMEGPALLAFTVADTIAFGVTTGIIFDSVPAVLIGTTVPFLVQRSIEHRDLLRERDRARALLAETQRGREAETQAAALQERGRIAREMHDVLAHSLAGLSVQLQAVRAVAAREKTGPAVLEPLDKAAALAREGLTEARAVVGALRDPVGLGVGDLPALVERHPGDATLVAHGTPGAVDAAAGHAVYRAVQESMTNAARYAPGSPVVVELGWQPARLTVHVRDSGPAPGRSPVGGQGSGLGLAGMAERVHAEGGSMQAGPRAEGGWAITVEVPTSDAPVRA